MGSLQQKRHVSPRDGAGGRRHPEIDVCSTKKIGSRGGKEGGVEGQGFREEEGEEESRIGEDVDGGGQEGEEDELLVVNYYTTSLEKQPAQPPPPPVPAVPPSQQQQAPHGSLVRWERFLPVQSLKVLLVENDDSTRQVLSALLRNCSYEVTATANGLEAWNVLEDLTNHVDLVLTEVVMPYLSGIGLLSKIMSHITCKNIPVIMMSSSDSMGIVFKCLSNGAVDFLVKPIRKNELKNLWQHVWRRCHSSSCSGSESGIQTQKSVKMKCVESDNTGSNSEDDNTSTGLNIGVGSDNGSGTQSSWTKCAAEPEDPQPMSPTDQWADPPNSTCAQVIHSKAETFCNELESMAGNMDGQEKKIPEDESMSKDSMIGECRNPKSLINHYPNGNDHKVPPNITQSLKERVSAYEKENPQQLNDLNPDVSKLTIEPSSKAVDHIGVVADPSNLQDLPKVVLNDTHMISESNDKASGGAEEFPFLELGLNRLSSTRNGGTGITDDRSVLRHSDLSAFSRYNTSAASNQTLRGSGRSCSFPVESSSGAMKVESYQNTVSTSNVPPDRSSNRNCNDDDIGSTIRNSFAKPILCMKPAAISAVKGTRSSAFHPVLHQSSATQVRQEKIDDLMGCRNMVPPRGIHCQVKVQQKQHQHYHHHLVPNMQQQQPELQNPADQDDFTLKIMSSAAPQCGSSNLFSGPMECNAANYSINGSVSGSNHGSSAAANTGGLNVDSESRFAVKSGAGDGNGSGSGSGSGVDENRFTQREAALNKFRQKRKERCFEKKVRYQSRKRLAEQRPRVRGQFVRQAAWEQKGNDADC